MTYPDGGPARHDEDDSTRPGAEGADAVEALTRRIHTLESELRQVRDSHACAPDRTRQLERSLEETRRLLDGTTAHNEQLRTTLRQARDQITTLHAEVEKLAQPPSGFAVLVTLHPDGTADVLQAGRKLRVEVSPDVRSEDLTPGREVLLNEALNVVAVHEHEDTGEVTLVKEIMAGGDRALVVGHSDDERVVRLATPILGEVKVGDSLLVDTRSGFALERVPKSEVEDLVLEEVPDIAYESIGGLGGQIELIRDAVELPYLHPELFAEHKLRPPKGILLYGPPGCGKTLIAKAVANSLAKKVAERTGAEGRSYFLNIKGPELLNKFVGETERHIRLVFQRAREKASMGTPVIVFFDEMDSLFRTRGSGVSSDVENTIVPQLLSEIDGVETLENVLVIGASNREDMIDPAILRPGRLDVKIKIERPDAQSAHDIFAKYLTADLPLAEDDLAEFGGSRDACVDAMIRTTVERMYRETDENRFLEVTYADGDKEVLYFKDFNSGAMIQNIVDRAKKSAIKDLIETGRRGIRVQHLLQACVDEFKENEDLPNTTNPDDWARISGKKGERIVFIRTLVTGKQGTEPGRSIDTATSTGQYL
ncbi:proteasome ATPase [Nocardioides yefusunii]|uniref:AAA ATPase forming ring-shaped complexes n=1 Tax=Nocardioides yefusunii TaxID=2500546 RepID=A0ABW1QVT0_9ACTN|nr:proteasome ATPase [Nocardioides yefusunii]